MVAAERFTGIELHVGTTFGATSSADSSNAMNVHPEHQPRGAGGGIAYLHTQVLALETSVEPVPLIRHKLNKGGRRHWSP
jgi:hypothetical protein